jgi:prephenate dehydratase
VLRALQPFVERRVSLSKSRSRSIKGRSSEANVAQILEELKKRVEYLKILGSYPHIA